jgi:HSP20 family molecular chaperone IbpA
MFGDMFKDPFKDPFFNEHENRIMKTDIREKEDTFIIDIDLPGYDKENIQIEVENGYLTVQASISEDKEEKEKGKFVRRERFNGTCSRSFYVGDDVKSEDVKAKFKNGILSLEIPKKDETKEVPEKKYIQIED